MTALRHTTLAHFDDAAARLALAQHERTVRHISSQLRHAASRTRVLDEDDLRAEGRIAVLEAVALHRDKGGTKLETWIAVRVRQRMIDAIRRHSVLSRSELRAARRSEGSGRVRTLVTFDEERSRRQESPSQGDAEKALREAIINQQRRRLRRAIDTLPHRERTALTLTLMRGLRPSRVSRVMGVSPSRVTQLQKRAVSRLKRAMRQERCMSVAPAPMARAS